MALTIDEFFSIAIFITIVAFTVMHISGLHKFEINSVNSENLRDYLIKSLSVKVHKIPFKILMNDSFNGVITLNFPLEGSFDRDSVIVKNKRQIINSYYNGTHLFINSSFRKGWNYFYLIYFEGVESPDKNQINSYNNSLLLDYIFSIDEMEEKPFINKTINESGIEKIFGKKFNISINGVSYGRKISGTGIVSKNLIEFVNDRGDNQFRKVKVVLWE